MSHFKQRKKIVFSVQLAAPYPSDTDGCRDDWSCYVLY